MLVITESKGELFVVHLGKNGRELSTTKSFTQKPSAWTNIVAQAAGFGPQAKVFVQDNSLKDEAKVYEVKGDGSIKERSDLTPKKLNLDGVKLKERKHPLKGQSVAKKASPKKAAKKATAKKEKASPKEATAKTKKTVSTQDIW